MPGGPPEKKGATRAARLLIPFVFSCWWMCKVRSPEGSPLMSIVIFTPRVAGVSPAVPTDRPSPRTSRMAQRFDWHATRRLPCGFWFCSPNYCPLLLRA